MNNPEDAANAEKITTINRTCPTCEASCGLVVTIDEQAKKIVSVQGDPDDHRSNGYVCAKSQAFRYIYEDNERLRAPVHKQPDGSWKELSWDAAYALAREKLSGILSEHGKDALSIYVGNPTGHQVNTQLFLQALMGTLQTERFFSAGTVDQHPQQMGSFVLYGKEWMFPIPDLDNTDFFIVMGANPMVSQGSLMSAPDIETRIKDLQARGGKMIVIDPRFTETAELANQHIYIKPGTDAYMLMAFINEIFATNKVDLGHLQDVVEGIDDLRDAVQTYTPESTAAITGIDAKILRQLVQQYCAADMAAAYGRIGLCTQKYGTLASWLVDIVSLITGNLDARGGMMFPRTATDRPGPGTPDTDEHWGRWKSRVRGFPETCGELPANLMAEEITAPGKDKIRGLITVCGNPVLSVPNGKEIREALGTLDFMVAVDIYINETTSQADLILPSTVQPEHSNYDLTFSGTSVRNFTNYSPRMFEPENDLRGMDEILCELAGGLAGISGTDMDAFAFDGVLDMAVATSAAVGRNLDKDTIRAQCSDEPGWERMVDVMLRNGPYGDGFDDRADGLSLQKLKDAGGTIDLGPLEPQLPKQLYTVDQRIRLMHPMVVDEFARVAAAFAEQQGNAASESSQNDMLLIGRRHIRDMNSWLHNLTNYVRGKNRCTMMIHSDDAIRLGLSDGGNARVTSRVGETLVPVEVTDNIMPGVVSIPHGFGHVYDDSQQSKANEKLPGISCNDIIDHLEMDEVSGTSVVNGAAVQVFAA